MIIAHPHRQAKRYRWARRAQIDRYWRGWNDGAAHIDRRIRELLSAGPDTIRAYLAQIDAGYICDGLPPAVHELLREAGR